MAAAAYLTEHKPALEAAITAALGAAVRARAHDPIAFVAQRLAEGSLEVPTLAPLATGPSFSRAAMDDMEYRRWHGDQIARVFGDALRAVVMERAADPLQSFARHAMQFAEDAAVGEDAVIDVVVKGAEQSDVPTRFMSLDDLKAHT